MFLGEFQHTMDSKGRVVIPSKFREELQQGCVITKGQDNCLQILTKSNWEEEAIKNRLHFHQQIEHQGN